MGYDMNRKRVGLCIIIGRVVLCSLLLVVTSTCAFSFTLQTPMISASKKLSTTHTFARRNNSSTRIFVSLSSPESDKSEDKVIREPSATISLSKDIKSSSNNVEEEEDFSDNQFNLSSFNSDTIISNISTIAITLLIASLCLSLVGNVGGAVASELAKEVSHLFSILINITAALGTTVFGMLKFILPVVGKGVADGVVAATPIVKDAAYSASQLEIVQTATDAVASTTLPLLDTVGQAVDTSIVSPVQQAVDTSFVNPIQEAAGSVGTAINQALPDVPDLPKVSAPELPTLPALPSMPDVDSSITIGGVTIF